MQLTDEQRDVLSEIVNLGMGYCAKTLSEIVEQRIVLSVPDVCLMTGHIQHFLNTDLFRDDDIILLSQSFDSENFTGTAYVVFPKESSINLLRLVSFEDADIFGIDEITQDGLKEIANTLINSCIGTISNALNLSVNFGVPGFIHLSKENMDQQIKTLVQIENASTFLIDTTFKVKDHNIKGSVLLIMSEEQNVKFLNVVDQYVESMMK